MASSSSIATAVSANWLRNTSPGAIVFAPIASGATSPTKPSRWRPARRRTEALPRDLFNRRCNVEASIFQLSYHTRKKKLKYRSRCAVQLWAVCRAAWINIKRMVIYQEKFAEILV